MKKGVKLSDVIEAMQFQSDLSRNYFDRHTGQVVLISDEDISAAEDREEDEAPEWQRESIELAQALEADTEDRFVALPEQFEIH